MSFLSGGEWPLTKAWFFCLKESPEQVILDLQPEWVAMDEAFTVKCHVPSVAPLRSLTLTLLQDGRQLHRKDFMNFSVASQRAEVTVNVRAQQENDRSNFSCHAELDLSPHGGWLLHGRSATKELWIFSESESRHKENPGPVLAFGDPIPTGLGEESNCTPPLIHPQPCSLPQCPR